MQLQEAREFQYGACCAQLVVGGINRQGGNIINSVRHLASNNAVPDERIQLQLVIGEVLLHFGRGTHNAGRTNRLMRVLSVLFCAVVVFLRRAEFAAEVLLDIVTDFGNSNLCQTHGVGSHIGNQADGGFAQRYAFIKLLCQHHGLFCAEVELFIGLLLHAGGSKRRYGVTLAFFLYGVAHDVISLGESFFRCSCLLLVMQLQLFALIFYCFRFKELSLAAFTQLGAQCPVFYRHEILDFTVAVGNDFGSNGLYAAGAQALADFAPQQRAQLIAYDAVQNAACLLCINHIHVNAARMLDSVLDSGSGNLMKFNAAGRCRVDAQNKCQMPADCFTLAVRVSCQQNFVGFFGFSLQGFD